MTTSHRSPAARRLAAALLAAVSLPLLLAGCAPQSEAAVEQYARTLESAAAVREASVSISTPLPFTVQGSVWLELDEHVTRESLDELRELACSTDANASIRITLEYAFSGGAALTQSNLQKCWDDPVSFLEALPALESHAAEFSSVTWRETEFDDGDHREIVIQPLAPDAAAGAALADATLAALVDQTPTEVTVGLFTAMAESVDEGRTVAQAVVGLAGVVLIQRATYNDGLFVQLATPVAGSVEKARAYLALTRPTLRVLGVVDSAVEVSGNGIPGQALLDAEAMLSAEGVVDAVSVSADYLYVRVSSASKLVDVAELMEAEGAGDIPIRYSVILEAGADPVATLTPGRSGIPLTAREVEDATTVVEAFLATDRLGRIDYTPELLGVFLAEDYYDDAASEEEFVDIMRDLIDDGVVTGSYGYATVNNEEVPLD